MIPDAVLLLAVVNAVTLPPGAVLRLGDPRFRAGGEVTALAFSPDATQLVSWQTRWGEAGAMTVWDAATGARLRDVPRGTYTVFVYVWEDNDPQTFTLSLEGKPVATVNSGKGGTWQKLGPWKVEVKDGTLDLTSSGGHANLSGVEIWKGAGTPPASAAASIPEPSAVVLVLVGLGLAVRF